MIPDKFIPNRQQAKEIILCISEEINQMLSMNIRFYMVKISRNILYATLHHCCTEIDNNIIPEYQVVLSNKIIHNTNIKKVVWE